MDNVQFNEVFIKTTYKNPMNGIEGNSICIKNPIVDFDNDDSKWVFVNDECHETVFVEDIVNSIQLLDVLIIHQSI